MKRNTKKPNNAIWIILLAIPVLIIVVAYFSKPSEQECKDHFTNNFNQRIDNTKQKKGWKFVEKLGNDMVGQSFITVEDDIVYETIYNNVTNEKLGIGYLGTIKETKKSD